MPSRTYSLYRSHQVLRQANKSYRAQWNTLAPYALQQLERALSQLDQAILNRDRKAASELAHEVEDLGGQHFKRSWLRSTWEFLVAIAFALIIATIIRQVWFEPYKIPTGSMRPTFREQDHLTVSKTEFGINTPLQTSHLYFDPTLLRRAGVVIFSADGLDMADTDTTYFWLFPAKKRLIKRLMGMPGDTVYFYGGKLYGIDKDGQDISAELNPPFMEKLDHVPFMYFEGRTAVDKVDSNGRVQEIILKQLNQPVGKLTVNGRGLQGSVYSGNEWVADSSNTADGGKRYFDMLGMSNYAMARVLTAEELATIAGSASRDVGNGILYLELRHNPSLTYPEPKVQRAMDGQFRIHLPAESSYLPLTEEHIKALMDAMYTVRFVVQDGRATAYAIEGQAFSRASPHFGDVANGTYEIYYGKAYQVSGTGVTTELPADHPLNRRTPANLQRLFNVGIEMNTAFEPQGKDQLNFPARYAYFRDGNLYVMGGQVMSKDDAVLKTFVERESKRESSARKDRPYVPFKDRGEPYKDGVIDSDFIRAYGMRVPDKHYLVLGDNYARSGDSRAFGFVPEANMQGVPSWILWPSGARWGAPVQTQYPLFTLPRMIVWAIAALTGLLWYAYTRWQMRQPQFKKLSGG